MRRAIQLRMTFSSVWEGGIEGECGWKHHCGQIESGVMIVAGSDRDEMDQRVIETILRRMENVKSETAPVGEAASMEERK